MVRTYCKSSHWASHSTCYSLMRAQSRYSLPCLVNKLVRRASVLKKKKLELRKLTVQSNLGLHIRLNREVVAQKLKAPGYRSEGRGLETQHH